MVLILIILGLGLGVFLNLIIQRLPRTDEHDHGSPAVGHARQNNSPGHGIADWATYAVVEGLSALILTTFYARHGLSPLFFYLVLVSSILLVTGAIDWLHRSIYLFIVLGGATCAIIVSNFIPGHTVGEAFLGLMVVGLGFGGLFFGAQLLFPSKATPFGLGDVYLGMFLGAALGLTRRLGLALAYGMLLAGAVASVIVLAKYLLRRQNLPEYISYGTYLCLGTIGYLILYGW